MVRKILEDWRSAPIPERLRATVGFIDKLTLDPAGVTPEDVAPLREQGLSDQDIQDALLVCSLFQIINRIADALDFAVPESQRHAPYMPAGT